jgi:hypothetical protein
MWWIAFTAFDLYIGLVVFEAMMPTLPPEKLKRAKAVRNLILASLAITVIAFLIAVVKRWMGRH